MSKDESLPKGIRPYHNRYRAFASVAGQPMQEYFEDLSAAIEWREKQEKRRAKTKAPGSPNTRGAKRRTAIHKDLPPGYSQCSYWRKDPNTGEKRWPIDVITTVIVVNNKRLKSFGAQFGEIRTRKEALEIVMEKRRKWCEEHGLGGLPHPRT